jgi:serine/threonine protein kinase
LNLSIRLITPDNDNDTDNDDYNTTTARDTMQRHSFQALNSSFVVDADYSFVKELGQGAYGCVVAAKHRVTGEGCAIKKITNINTKVRSDHVDHVFQLTVNTR